MSANFNDFVNRDSNANPASVAQLIATQAGTAAPSTDATLVNTTGKTLTWARTSAGLYTLTASGSLFTAGKTYVQLSFGGTAVTGKVAVTSSTVLTFTFTDGATPSAADLVGTLFLRVEVWD